MLNEALFHPYSQRHMLRQQNSCHQVENTIVLQVHTVMGTVKNVKKKNYAGLVSVLDETVLIDRFYLSFMEECHHQLCYIFHKVTSILVVVKTLWFYPIVCHTVSIN